MQNKIQELKENIEKAKKIALLTHIRMDPDTFWSAAAFYYILEKMWKKVILLNDEKAPDDFSFLWANKIVSTNIDLKEFKPDLVISLDAASISQLAESYQKNKEIINSLPFFVIDHHISNPWFWKINIINPKASSTCEFLFSILKEINLIKYIDKKIATLLIAGILTDTNVFYNTNVSSKTHKISAELLELWADSRKCIFNFFKKNNLLKLKLLAKAIENIRIVKNKLNNWKNITITSLTKKDFEELKAKESDREWIVEYLINLENTEIAIFIYPIKNWQNKVSLRSQEYNVSELAQKFDWWGHKQASGFSSEKSIENIIEDILENI